MKDLNFCHKTAQGLLIFRETERRFEWSEENSRRERISTHEAIYIYIMNASVDRSDYSRLRLS